jgi:MATE family, multidrug and toxin extrusion protein
MRSSSRQNPTPDILQYSFTVTTTIVAGHLAADDLAAASLGLSTLNIIGLAIFEGMATALDTLCSQSYGSGRFTGVGCTSRGWLYS